MKNSYKHLSCGSQIKMCESLYEMSRINESIEERSGRGQNEKWLLMDMEFLGEAGVIKMF